MMMSAVEGKTLPNLNLNSSLPIVTAPLPAWPRSGHPSDRSRFTRPARRDRLQSIPQQPPLQGPRPPASPRQKSASGAKSSPTDKDNGEAGLVDPLQRVFHLERNLRFLREQHHLLLTSLHAEVEELKVKNRDLQFQLVMGPDIASTVAQQGAARPEDRQRATAPGNMHEGSDPRQMKEVGNVPLTADKISKLETLQVENRDLRAAVHDARNRNMYLTSLIEQMKRQQRQVSERQNKRPITSDCQVVMAPGAPSVVSIGEVPSLYLHKFEEYEDAIQKLRRENVDMQTELSRLKGTLREILCSNKWTPEAYIIARSVLQEGNSKAHEPSYHRLPRIPVRPHEPSRRSSLPAIAPRNFNALHVVRCQQTLPTVPQSKPPRSNPPGTAHLEHRYKQHSSAPKKQ